MGTGYYPAQVLPGGTGQALEGPHRWGRGNSLPCLSLSVFIKEDNLSQKPPVDSPSDSIGQHRVTLISRPVV